MDDEVSFTTVADNELDIISKIKEQFPLLTTEQITAKLQLQFKDEKSQGIDSNVEDINREEITNTDVLFDDKNELSDDDDKKSEAEDDDTNQEYANPNENQERLIIDVTKRSQDKSHNQDNEDNKDDNDEGEGDDNNN